MSTPLTCERYLWKLNQWKKWNGNSENVHKIILVPEWNYSCLCVTLWVSEWDSRVTSCDVMLPAMDIFARIFLSPAGIFQNWIWFLLTSMVFFTFNKGGHALVCLVEQFTANPGIKISQRFVIERWLENNTFVSGLLEDAPTVASVEYLSTIKCGKDLNFLPYITKFMWNKPLPLFVSEKSRLSAAEHAECAEYK